MLHIMLYQLAPSFPNSYFQDFSYNDLKTEGANLIVEALKYNQQIEHLNISGMGLFLSNFN